MKNTFLILSLLILTNATVHAAQQNNAASQPTTRPYYVGVKLILLQVPKDVYPAPNKQWTKIKAEVANDALQKVLGRTAMLSFKVREAGHGGTETDIADDEDAYWIISDAVPCDRWEIEVTCYFHVNEKAALAAINVDDIVRVQGQITRCEFRFDSRRGWLLRIDLSDARLLSNTFENRTRTRG